MNPKWPLVFLLALALWLGNAHPARADGIIVPPEPPPCPGRVCPPFPPRPIAQLNIRYHHVMVTIENQLAVTRVEQVFENPNDWPVEGTYIFPLPREAVVNNFSLWVDGEPVVGKVLSAEEARQTYESIVANLRDPALLEYIDRGAVQASIFPIPPQGERKVALEYTQALTAENGLVRYVYPLNTEKFSALPLEDVSIRVEIRDRQAIRAVYSPSHAIDVERQQENQVVAGYEAHNVLPDSDFSLLYSLGESEAFHLFSYRDPTDPQAADGFFLLLLAPKPDAQQERVAKDVLLVLDRSGSMEGEKFQQAQTALRYILQKLNPEDRFHLLSFSTGIEMYAPSLRPAEDAAEALAWVDRLSAAGSTDINRALLESVAVMDKERPTYLIFLTDGLPTEGVVNTQEILENFARSAPANLRLFSFGVGYDVDTVLLDSLAQEHHGLSTYVGPGEALDEVLSGFYERISTPVLTNLSLDFGDLATYDLYPNPLPDLFAGQQVVVVGRYRDGGTTDVTLRGEVNGAAQALDFAGQVFAQDARGSSSVELIPRLWATRKIGYLLNQVRIQGADKELIDQIVRLSIRYGVITPYTSYLVSEDLPLGAASQERIVEDAYKSAANSPDASSGQAAVERAVQEGALQGADVAPQTESGLAGAAIRVVGARTYLLQESVWMDTTYDPQSMKLQKLAFLSPAYYQLLAARPDLASALALGQQVLVVVEGKAYQVVADGETSGSLDLPPALAATQSPPVSATLSPTSGAATPTAVVPPPPDPASRPARPARQTGLCFGPLAVGLAPLVVLVWRRRSTH